MKHAVVTGATSGIGKAIALKLSREGFSVSAVGRDAKRGDNLTQNAANIKFRRADIADPKEVQRLFSEFTTHDGFIDVLVNAAGIEQEFDDPLDTEQWIETFNTNLFGAVECIRRTLPLMKSGVIVNISSAVGGNKVVFPTYDLSYEASKAALQKVTESIAITHAPRIRAITISPGYTWTPMWDKSSDEVRADCLKLVPIARFVTPDEVALSVHQVIVNEAFNGVEIVIDGGLSLRKID